MNIQFDKKATTLKYLLVLLWMVIIFTFSSKSADDSNKQSDHVGRMVCRIIYTGFDDMSEEVQASKVEGINFFIRKAAHLTEYAVLGILLAIAMNHKRNSILLGIGILYACTDEFHQLFVFGRSGQISDVLIDSVGVLIGICIYRGLTPFVNGVRPLYKKH